MSWTESKYENGYLHILQHDTKQIFPLDTTLFKADLVCKDNTLSGGGECKLDLTFTYRLAPILVKCKYSNSIGKNRCEDDFKNLLDLVIKNQRKL